ncbi:MAG: hypothetical protein ACLQUW_08115 [Desulfobaccales bacterium]
MRPVVVDFCQARPPRGGSILAGAAWAILKHLKELTRWRSLLEPVEHLAPAV